MRLYVATLLLLWAATTHAAIPGEVIDALRPVDGVVVKVDGDDCLIDLGSNSGLRDGDLVAVINRGEELRHPTTGKRLGQLDSIRTLLRVVRLKPDFAWARPLTPGVPLHAADPVRRFGEVPALFLPRQEADHTLYNELHLALPHLAWRPWGEKELAGAGLYFVREGDELIVRDQRGVRLGAWSLETASPLSVPQKSTAASGLLRPVGGRFSGKGRGLSVVDLNSDGRREVVIALDNRIEIGEVAGQQWKTLFTYNLPVSLAVLALDAADLDDNGTPELLVSAVRGEQLASLILSCDIQGCRETATALPWFLRVVDLPGRGLTPLAQQGGGTSGSDYYGQPFTFTLHAGQVIPGDPFPLPAPLNLLGMQPFSRGDVLLWSYLDNTDRLVVSDGKEELWTSRDRIGGGESYIDRADRNKKRGETRRFYLPPRIAPAQGGIVVPQNLGDGAFANRRSAEASRLVGFHWDGRALDRAWSSPDHDGYLADFVHGDIDNDGQDEYLLLGSRDGGLFEKAITTLSTWRP